MKKNLKELLLTTKYNLEEVMKKLEYDRQLNKALEEVNKELKGE